MSSVRFLALATATLIAAAPLASACSRDFDQFDPRLATTTSAQGGAGSGASSGTAGSGGTAGAGGAGGATSGDCGTVWVLSEDFEDGVIEQRVWDAYAYDPATIAETGGVLEITIPPDLNNSFDARLGSNFAYDLTDRTVTVELPQALVNPADGELDVWLTVGRDSDNYVQFLFDDGILNCAVEINDQWSTIFSITYSLDKHRWWQFEDDGANVNFNVSGDGVNWETLTQYDLNQVFDRRWTEVWMGAYGYADTATSVVQFDNLNVDVPSENHCAMSSWSDDFDDDVVSQGWERDPGYGGCAVDESGGEVHFECAAGAYDDYYQLRTRSAFDLTGSSVTVHNTEESLPGSEMQTYLSLWDSTESNGFLFNMDTDTMYVIKVEDGNWYDVAQKSYSAGQYGWLRISEDGGIISFEASADGGDWEPIHGTVPTFDYTALQVRLTGSTQYDPLTADRAVSMDNYNVAP